MIISNSVAIFRSRLIPRIWVLVGIGLIRLSYNDFSGSELFSLGITSWLKLYIFIYINIIPRYLDLASFFLRNN